MQIDGEMADGEDEFLRLDEERCDRVLWQRRLERFLQQRCHHMNTLNNKRLEMFYSVLCLINRLYVIPVDQGLLHMLCSDYLTYTWKIGSAGMHSHCWDFWWVRQTVGSSEETDTLFRASGGLLCHPRTRKKDKEQNKSFRTWNVCLWAMSYDSPHFWTAMDDDVASAAAAAKHFSPTGINMLSSSRQQYMMKNDLSSVVSRNTCPKLSNATTTGS